MTDRILVVDDEEAIRSLLVDALSYEGYECDEADGVENALVRLNAQEYSLVISDIIMSGGTGLELLQKIRTGSPDTFVIMLSGVVDTETAIHCIHLGAVDYLVKPFSNERLSVTVRNALKQRRLLLSHRAYEEGLKQKVREQTEQIKEALLENARVTKEMEIARAIQEALVPRHFPRCERLEFAATYRPAGFVGGDYYDFFLRGDGLLDAIIADVSGHNVGSALLVAEMRGALQRLHASGPISCAGILSLLNEALHDDLTRVGLLVSMFYLRFDERSLVLHYANAGHNRQMLLHGSGVVEELDAEGMILGVVPQVDFEEKAIGIAPGDRLLLFTDGISEAENAEGEQFGAQRLAAALEESRAGDSRQALANVIARLEGFIQGTALRDDLAMVVTTVH